jgi:hypothetical protein
LPVGEMPQTAEDQKHSEHCKIIFIFVEGIGNGNSNLWGKCGYFWLFLCTHFSMGIWPNTIKYLNFICLYFCTHSPYHCKGDLLGLSTLGLPQEELTRINELAHEYPFPCHCPRPPSHIKPLTPVLRRQSRRSVNHDIQSVACNIHSPLCNIG